MFKLYKCYNKLTKIIKMLINNYLALKLLDDRDNRQVK